MVLRTTLGATRRSAAQHSQSLHAWLSHIPGLKVVGARPRLTMPRGCSRRAIRDDNPVVFFEDKMMYQLKGPVPTEEYTIPFGVADVKRAGKRHHAGGHQQHGSGRASRGGLLEASGISAEVVDVRTTAPLDKQTIDRFSEKNQPRYRHRRRVRRLWRHCGDRFCDRRRRVLLSRCAGQTHGRDGRAGAVLAGARRSNRADTGNCGGYGAEDYAANNKFVVQGSMFKVQVVYACPGSFVEQLEH